MGYTAAKGTFTARTATAGTVIVGTAILVLIIWVIIAAQAHAHLVGGIHKESGEYTIDLGHDPEMITAGIPTAMLLSVVKTGSEDALETQSLWVRIRGEKESIFAGRFYAEPTGAYLFTFTFPDSGKYHIQTRFATHDGPIETEFAVDVLPQSERREPNFFVVVTIVLAAWLVTSIIFISMRRWSRRRNNSKR